MCKTLDSQYGAVGRWHRTSRMWGLVESELVIEGLALGEINIALMGHLSVLVRLLL